MKFKESKRQRLNKPIIKTVYNNNGKCCPYCKCESFYNYNDFYIICCECGLILSSKEPTTKGAGYFYKNRSKETKKRKQHKTVFYNKYKAL